MWLQIAIAFVFGLQYGFSQVKITPYKLGQVALERTKLDITYDGRYYAMDYPNGDVPSHLGVCTDVVIRTYRKFDIDLQKLVHEDMKKNFREYPAKRIWGQATTDKNIDHRRVPNLQVFFSKFGKSFEISQNPNAYQTGDVVTWMLPGNKPHIGIVIHQKASLGTIPLIVHNIGSGPKLENMLFEYPITGHYRYIP